MIRTILKLSVCVIITSILASCGSDRSSESNVLPLQGTQFNPLSGNLSITDGIISGTGKMVANLPLDSVQSAHHFEIAFRIPNGGALKLLTHATDTLESGNAIRFVRQRNIVIIEVDSLPVGQFETSAETDTLRATIDVHNDESEGAHILVWAGGASTAGTENPLCEPHRQNGLLGAGSYWGLELDQATVSLAKFGDAIDQD